MRGWLTLVMLAGCASASSNPDPKPQDLSMPIIADLSSTDLADGAVSVGPVLLTTSFGAVPGPLAFVAGQDGDGAWTKLTSTDGHYQLPVTTGRYGLFWICPPTQFTSIGGLFTSGGPVWLAATRAELSDVKAYCPAQQGSAIYNSLAANAAAVEVCAGAECAVTQQKSFTQTVAFNPPIGLVDLFTGRIGSGSKLNDVRVARDQSISTTPGTPTPLDTTTGFTALVSNSLTSNATGSDALSVQTSWRLRNGLDAVLSIGSPPSILAVPVAQLSAEEVQRLAVAATSSVTSDSLRIVSRYFRTPATLDVQLPAIFGTVTPSSVAGVGEKTIKLIFTQSAGAQGYFGSLRQGGGEVAMYRIFLSAGWVGANTMVTAPALNILGGFPATYLWTNPAQWQFGAITSSKTFADLFNLSGLPAATMDGYVNAFSLRTGNLSP